MQINWAWCPLVAQNPIMRAFIEQLIKERKSASTIENYARDLNDFLSAFPDTLFSDLLEADESQIVQYVDWLWTRDAHRGSGHKADRSTVTYLTGSKLAPTTIRRHISSLRSFYRWAIRLHHRRDSINPIREGVHGQGRGLVSVPTSVPWIPFRCCEKRKKKRSSEAASAYSTLHFSSCTYLTISKSGWKDDEYFRLSTKPDGGS